MREIYMMCAMFFAAAVLLAWFEIKMRGGRR